MRISSILLIATAIVAASSDSVLAATDSRQISSIETQQINKRALSTTKTEKEEDDNGTNVDEADEERIGLGSLKTTISNPLLRPVDEVLASIKSPTITKQGQEILARLENNPLAKKFAKVFGEKNWSTQELKTELGIKATTPLTDPKYKALSVLLDVRAYNNNLQKAKFPNTNKTDKLGEQILDGLNNNPLAAKFVKQFRDEKWTTEVLKSKLGITWGTPQNSKKYEAFALLLRVRAYENTLAKANKIPSINTNSDKLGKQLLERLDNNPLAKGLVDQFRAEKWTTEVLKSKLGITRGTPKNSKKYEAFALLLRVRAHDSALAKANKIPSINTNSDKLGKQLLERLDNNPLAKGLVDQFRAEKWTTEVLKSKLGITRGTPKNSKEYEAFALLLRVRAHDSALAKAK